MEKKTQCDIVLEHMQKHGSITIYDSIYKYGITRLSDVIYKLKKQGYVIEAPLEKVKTRYGTTMVSVYKLR